MAKESSKISPKNVYGKTKVKAENYVKSLFKNKNFCILRYFNVVGATPEKNIGQIKKTKHIFSHVNTNFPQKQQQQIVFF